MCGIAYVQDPGAGEQMGVSRMAGRHDAVEHVDAAAYRLQDVLRPAHAHQITRLPGRHLRGQVGDHAVAFILRFTDRQAAHREPFEADGLERRERFQPQSAHAHRPG